MTPADAEFLNTTVDLVRRAGILTLQWFRQTDLHIERKDDGTPVTAADRAAERFVREEIARLYPDDTVIGEEEADQNGTSGRTWIIDPIDGTKAFARGIPLYSNLLAVNDEEGPLLAVINLPALDQTVYAGRGLGCFLNGQPAHVAERVSLADAYVSTSSYSNWPDDSLLRIKHTGASLRTWGDGYGFALVATGRINVMADPQAELWDVAPMPLILHEAGGRFTDWSGRDDPAGGSGLVTGGIDHDELLALLG